jgi:hypothetical protein
MNATVSHVTNLARVNPATYISNPGNTPWAIKMNA